MKFLRLVLYLVLVYLVGSTFWGWALRMDRNATEPAPIHGSWYPSQNNADIDSYLIHYGVASHPTFVSTLRWWVGPWGPGELQIPGQDPQTRVAFYRPVSSTAFWLQWQIHGENENRYGNWNLVGGAVYVLLFLATLTQVYRRFVGDLAHFRFPLFLIVGYQLLVDGYGFNPAGDSAFYSVLGIWKNLPDLLAGSFVLLTIVAFLSMPRYAKKPWMNLVWAIPLFLACGSKEVVTLLPLALPFLDYPIWKSGDEDLRHGARTRLFWSVGYLVLFQIFRMTVIGGVGYRYGSNSFWFVRLVSGLTYPWGPIVMRWDVLQLATGFFALLALFSFIWLYRKEVRWTRSIAGAFAYFVAWLMLISASIPYMVPDADIPTASMLIPTGFFLVINMVGQATIALVASPFLIVYLWKHRREWFWFGLAWIVLTGIPNIFSPGLSHRDFVPSFGWALFYGAAIAFAVSDWIDRTRTASTS